MKARKNPPSWTVAALAGLIVALVAPAKLAFGYSLRLARLTEEPLGAADMPATPTATATPGAESSAPATLPPTMTIPAGVAPAATVAPTTGPAAVESGSAPSPAAGAEPPPEAAAPTGGSQSETPELPPIEPGSTLTLQVSDSPLTGLIDNAPNPARAASMRVTEQARKEILEGRGNDAVRSLTGALSIDSSNPYAYFYLGRAYLAKKDYKQALTFFQRAEIGFGSDPLWLGETISFEGSADEQSGDTNAALAAYKRALDGAPNNLMARVGYGRLSATVQPDVTLSPGTEGVPPAPAVTGVEPPPESPGPESAPSESAPPVAEEPSPR